MKIKALMVPDPITISEEASVAEAIALMKVNAIRHLPVVDDGRRLLGFVTLADLKQGLIPSMVEPLTLRDLMIRQPITISPESHIETAARLIYRHKIGGLPVVKGGRVVGIITESDILRAFIDMMGLLGRSTRVEVRVGSAPGAFKRAVQVIQEAGGDIINVAMNPHQHGEREYLFRLSAGRAAAVRAALTAAGFRVTGSQE
jgi:acetoin utilization protein AcuB